MAGQILPITQGSSISIVKAHKKPIQTTAKKIQDLAKSFLYSFLSGNFFSSKQFYQTIEATLLSAAFLGMLGSMGLLITGSPFISLMMMGLSSTTAVGAYAAHQASLQQTFVENAIAIKLQVQTFARQNQALAEQNQTFAGQNQTFAEQNQTFAEQNQTLKNTIDLLLQLATENNQDKMKQLTYFEELKQICLLPYRNQKTLSI